MANQNERKSMNNKFDELTKGLAQSVRRRGALKKFGLGLAGMAIVAGALVWTVHPTRVRASDTLPATAAAIRVTTGNTFALVPTADPTVFGHPVDGVAQVSLMGNAHFHGEGTVYFPTSAGQPIRIVSTTPWTLTSSDGANSLEFDVEGTAAFDPANSLFGNVTYNVTFVGGTGKFVGAKGAATMEVTAQFYTQLTGLANWTMKGVVITPPAAN